MSKSVFEPEFLRVTMAEEAEHRLLALLLSDSLDDPPDLRSTVLAEVAAVIAEDDFLSPHYRNIYFAVSRSCVPVLIPEQFPDLRDLVSTLIEFTHPLRGTFIPYWHATLYARKVHDAAEKRRAYTALTNALRILYDPGKTADDALAAVPAAMGMGHHHTVELYA